MSELIRLILILAVIALAIATILLPFFVWSINNRLRDANKTNREAMAILARIESMMRNGDVAVAMRQNYD